MTVRLPRKPATDVQDQLTELARARDKYQAAFEEAADVMVIVDDDARIVDANPEAASLYGLDRQALLGQPVPKFHPEEFDFESEWKELQAAGIQHDTVTIVDADGERRRVDYSATTDIVPNQHLVISREVSN